MRWVLCLLLLCHLAPCILASWPGLGLPLTGMGTPFEQCLTPAEDCPEPHQQHQHCSIAFGQRCISGGFRAQSRAQRTRRTSCAGGRMGEAGAPSFQQACVGRRFTVRRPGTCDLERLPNTSPLSEPWYPTFTVWPVALTVSMYVAPLHTRHCALPRTRA